MILAMAAVAALASCSKEEQSELNFSDIQGTATIKGQVTYNNGYRTDNGSIVSSDQPAANVPVIAKVDYKNYSTKAEGTKIIEAVTDANGNYSLTIPCGQKPVNVKVQPRGFTAPYSMLLDGGKTMEVKAYFEDPETSVDVVMGDNKTENFFNVTKQSTENVTTRTNQIKFYGKIRHIWPADHKTDANKDESKSSTIKVVITNTATLPNGNADEREVVATVSASGEYTLMVAIFDDWNVEKLQYTITAEGFLYTYTDNTDKENSGYYNTMKVDKTMTDMTPAIGEKNDFYFGTSGTSDFVSFS